MNNYNRIHQMETDDMVEEIHNSRETIKELEQQLQAYKDREDKLREYCNEQGKDMSKLESIFTGGETKEYVLLNGFLQILNKEEK